MESNKIWFETNVCSQANNALELAVYGKSVRTVGTSIRSLTKIFARQLKGDGSTQSPLRGPTVSSLTGSKS